MSTAASVASSCSGRLAPTIGAVIAGCASTHATASVGSASAGFVGELRQLIDGVEDVVVPVPILVHLPGVAEHEPRALVGRLRAVVLARQHAARDRVVRDHADALFEAEREHLAFELAEQQVVAGLHGVEPREAAHLAAAERAREVVGEEVRTADVAHLAGADEVVERAEGFVDRRVRDR